MACGPPSKGLRVFSFLHPQGHFEGHSASLLFIWNNNMPPAWLGQQVIYALTDSSLETAKLAGETQFWEQGDISPPWVPLCPQLVGGALVTQDRSL